VNRQEVAIPPSLKLVQIVDFSLYMIKAILNERGDEIVDLARTNLFREAMDVGLQGGRCTQTGPVRTRRFSADILPHTRRSPLPACDCCRG